MLKGRSGCCAEDRQKGTRAEVGKKPTIGVAQMQGGWLGSRTAVGAERCGWTLARLKTGPRGFAEGPQQVFCLIISP